MENNEFFFQLLVSTPSRQKKKEELVQVSSLSLTDRGISKIEKKKP